MDERFNRVYAEISLTATRLDEVEKLIEQYYEEKDKLEIKLNNLHEEIELLEGEVFANECIEGKHPIVDWNDMPKYMKLQLQKMFNESLGNKQLNESSQKIVIDNAINKFKQFYHIEHFDVLKTNKEENDKLFENA